MTAPHDHLSDEILAEHVSAALSVDERAHVEAHLSACERCAAQLADASAARAALARLPQVGAPPGVADRALAEAAEQAPGRATKAGAPAWYRWGGIAAVAAVFVLLLTLVLPKIGGGKTSGQQGGIAAASAHGALVPIEILPGDFRTGDLTALAAGAAQGADGRSFAPVVPAASGVEDGGASGAPGTAQQATVATACVRRAFRRVDGTLVRLIQARFEGKPAYLGLYAVASGAGQPAEAVTVRVAAVSGCRPLSIAQAPAAP
jgi:anti-sigma factor RsiW